MDPTLFCLEYMLLADEEGVVLFQHCALSSAWVSQILIQSPRNVGGISKSLVTDRKPRKIAVRRHAWLSSNHKTHIRSHCCCLQSVNIYRSWIVVRRKGLGFSRRALEIKNIISFSFWSLFGGLDIQHIHIWWNDIYLLWINVSDLFLYLNSVVGKTGTYPILPSLLPDGEN